MVASRVAEALVVWHLPTTEGTRFVTLTGLDGERCILVLDGRTPEPVAQAFLARYWFGQAHVFWRDFENLGRTFGPEGRGTPADRAPRKGARCSTRRSRPR